MNFVIYFLLTCGLPIWQGSFSYKDVTACFGNLLVLKRSLIIFLQGFPIHPSYTRKEELVVFNDILISRIFVQIKTYDLWALSLFLLAKPKACLGLINTLFSARIQGLFGSG